MVVGTATVVTVTVKTLLFTAVHPPLVTTALKYVVAVNADVVKFVAVAPVIEVQVVLFGDDCHCTVPVFPVKLRSTVDPPQIAEALTDAVPATDVGLTVTVIATLGPSQPEALACET